MTEEKEVQRGTTRGTADSLVGVQFEGKETYVKGVFGDVAKVYDKMNNIMTFGMVKGWQKFLLNKTNIKPGQSGLDVGTGTGEMAFLLAERVGKGGKVVGLDLSKDMLAVAKEKMQTLALPCPVDFVEGNALALPYEDNTFDTAISGFALRNVTDIEGVIKEMERVIKPGCKVVCIEIAEPKNPLFRWGFRIHFGKVVPWVGHFFDKGRSINGRQPAYTWLRDSFTGFPHGENMVQIFQKTGLVDTAFYPKCFGSVNIYEGTKKS